MRNLRIAAIILSLSFIAIANNSLAKTVAVDELAGTGWQGQFTVNGIHQSIRIGFLRNLSSGRLLYFHKITSSGVVSEGLNAADASCQFSPRALSINSQSADPVAQISVYSCASSAQEEVNLENAEARSTKAVINVVDINLTRNGDKNSLEIVAEIIGNKVTYELSEQENLNSDTFESLENLHQWVTTP